jgi:DHA1 family multidrug resistance protein-like MFS transporter
MSTLVSVFCTFGYLIGGVLGDFSIYWTFMFQVVILSACGIALFVFLKDDFEYKDTKIQFTRKDINPFSSFLSIKKSMNYMFTIWMTSFFLIYISSTACDQCFNYYLKDQFNFPPSYNGYLKALMGFITLVVNFTVCRFIIKKTNIKHSFIIDLICCSISIVIMVVSKNIFVFLIAFIVYFAFNSINATLQQTIVSNMGTKKNSAEIVAFYNSVQSLGSVVGAAAAGLIYEINSISSFIFGCVLILATVIMMGVGSSIKSKPKQSA